MAATEPRFASALAIFSVNSTSLAGRSFGSIDQFLYFIQIEARRAAW